MLGEDPSERLDVFINKYILSDDSDLPPVNEIQEVAIIAQKGVIRDLDFEPKLLVSSVRFFRRVLLASIECGANNRQLHPNVEQKGPVNCCDPFKKPNPPSTITGVAPWAAKPAGIKGAKGGWTAGSAGKPMTVAPWLNSPGSSVGASLAKISAANRPAQLSDSVVCTMSAASLVREVCDAEECSQLIPLLSEDQVILISQVCCEVIDHLCSIGALRETAGSIAAVKFSEYTEEEKTKVCKGLKSLIVSFYLRFPMLRLEMRRKLASSILINVQQSSQVPRNQMGVRLHLLDGGAKDSSITLTGVISALEMLCGMVKGFRRSQSSRRHLEILRDSLLPLHAPSTMVDDRTPLLELIHKEVCLCLVAFVEYCPQVAAEILKSIMDHWPTALSANSTKEVLLLHETEMLLDHSPAEALEDPALRDLLMDKITSCFEGSKNFRVAERALMMFRSDGVLNLLRQHHDFIVPWMIPKLLRAASEHWNQSVLKMIGSALTVLDSMDSESFERLMGDRTQTVRETAARLNPPEDAAKLAADNFAKQNAIEKTRDARDLNLFKLALGHDLGVGAYSRVRFGKLIVKELPQSLWPHVAVKIQDREVMKAQGYAANVEREIKILRMIKHPSIVGFIGSFSTEQSVFIAMEFLPNGDLQTILAAKGSLSTSAARFVTAEIILGLQHLHRTGIVYGDLKPENVLFDAQFHVKLSDFGSSRLVSEEEEEEGVMQENRVEGTADYISPEVAMGTSRSTFASDAWALGCVLFQLLAGHVPIVSSLDRHLEHEDGIEGNKKKLHRIVQFSETFGATGPEDDFFDNGFPQEAKPLVRKLLSVDPAQRLDVAHPDGVWSDVKGDDFYASTDFDSLPSQQPPQFHSGLVSAATANDRQWNRRKQSMLWSPMPDNYSKGTSASVLVLPEEPEGSLQVILRTAKDVHRSLPPAGMVSAIREDVVMEETGAQEVLLAGHPREEEDRSEHKRPFIAPGSGRPPAAPSRAGAKPAGSY